jgi:hypothetical protein
MFDDDLTADMIEELNKVLADDAAPLPAKPEPPVFRRNSECGCGPYTNKFFGINGVYCLKCNKLVTREEMIRYLQDNYRLLRRN